MDDEAGQKKRTQPPYYLAPYLIGISHFPDPGGVGIRVGCPFASPSLSFVVPNSPLTQRRVGRATLSLSLPSSYSSYTHGRGIAVYFSGVAISSALNRFVHLDSPFAITSSTSMASSTSRYGFTDDEVPQLSTSPLHRPGRVSLFVLRENSPHKKH